MAGGEQGSDYFKELTHMIVGDGKCEICRAGEQSGKAGKR